MIIRTVATAICFTLAYLTIPATGATAGSTYRILHVMSYHADWAWNELQFAAFKNELSDLDVEYRVIEMDTKRRSDPDWIEQISAEAVDEIETWRPDLVYANDDNAQKFVVTRVPEGVTNFVFSAVNASPDTYNFDQRSDVTGVMEREHILQTIRLLQEIAPDTRRAAVLVDDGATWPGLIARMQSALKGHDGFEVSGYDVISTFDEYKRKVLYYQDKVDALGVLGVFTLKNENGDNVPFGDVLRWTAENSMLPDFSFWGSRTDHGTLCAVTVSAEAQGAEAGKMARRILVDGQAPRDIEMRPTLKGQPVISIPRAKALGLTLNSTTLLGSRVTTSYAW